MTAFGTQFMPEMIISRYQDNHWSEPKMVPSDKLTLNPGAHVLHYSSTCFEGLKAFRHQDGRVHIFRMNDNIQRMIASSHSMYLPAPEPELLKNMICEVVRKFADQVPEQPGSMYIRPTHIGDEPGIGKAAAPSDTSLLYVLLSPVGDYFSDGIRPLRILLTDQMQRCAPHMGKVKAGGNYASALGLVMEAKRLHQVDQVLFCPDGIVQETAASNFFVIKGNELITKGLDSCFLHGVTRDSILTLARSNNMVVSEVDLSINELLELAALPDTEAFLSGTAAVITPVGSFIYNGKEITVGNGKAGEKSLSIRKQLNDIQWGLSEDPHQWLLAL